MVDLATKQAFWREQLPKFEENYFFETQLKLLKFDFEQGNYVIRDDLAPEFQDDANDAYHRVNTGWGMWKRAIKHSQPEIDALKSENAELRAKLAKNTGWIGIQDCPPDPYEILMYTDGYDVQIGNHLEWRDEMEITHWQPLPQPPQGESHETP